MTWILETLDLLQEVIADYDGTVLLVSHDRDFLDRTVTVTLGLDGSGEVDIVAGGYAEWEAKRQVQTRCQKRKSTANIAGKSPRCSASRASAVTDLEKNSATRINGTMTCLPKRIEEIEEQNVGDSGRAFRSEPLQSRSQSVCSRICRAENTALLAEKEEAEMRWLELAEQVEAMEQAR